MDRARLEAHHKKQEMASRLKNKIAELEKKDGKDAESTTVKDILEEEYNTLVRELRAESVELLEELTGGDTDI